VSFPLCPTGSEDAELTFFILFISAFVRMWESQRRMADIIREAEIDIIGKI
jgi:hypothetical protein